MPNSINKNIRDFFLHYFDVRQEKENELETIESIKSTVEFKGTKLWVLFFATMIASLGLHVNSTSVIIGAMLISPLMGPIMGIGLGLGIVDFELVKQSFRYYLLAAVISILASTLFFLISPISDVQSELLARTTPTIYDVFIAFFGGLAGIFASSTKNKGNVIPGVAIATALMPPLCTAGFGLATGNMYYFLGALYLFFINSVFIGLSTYLVVRALNYPRKSFLDKKRESKVKRYIYIIVLSTIIPSIFFTYRIFKQSLESTEVRKFVVEELNFPDAQVISNKLEKLSDGHKVLHVMLIGKKVAESSIDLAKSHLDKYGLTDISLVIRQDFGHESVDVDKLKSTLMQDLYTNSTELLGHQNKVIDSLQNMISHYISDKQLTMEVMPELKALYPFVLEASFYKAQMVDTSGQSNQVFMAYLKSNKSFTTDQKEKLKAWLGARSNMKHIKLFIEKKNKEEDEVK